MSYHIKITINLTFSNIASNKKVNDFSDYHDFTGFIELSLFLLGIQCSIH